MLFYAKNIVTDRNSEESVKIVTDLYEKSYKRYNKTPVPLNSSYEEKVQVVMKFLIRYKDVREYLYSLDFPNDATIKEIIYSISTGKTRSVCKNGQTRKYSPVSNDFSFCGRAKECPCLAEHTNKALREKIANRTEDDQKKINEKIKETNMRKYGYDYAVNSSKSRDANKAVRKRGTDTHAAMMEKTRATNLKKYGHKNPMQNSDIQRKASATFMDKTGFGNPSNDPEVKRKKEQTMMTNYGVTSPMKSEVIRNRAKDTNLLRYGEDNPMKNSDIREKSRTTLRENYGVDNPMHSEEIKDKLARSMEKTYGVSHHSQINYSEMTKYILGSEERFIEFIAGKSFNRAASELGVNPSTIGDYCNLYNIKADTSTSSYENEISEFLTLHGIDFVSNDRNVISPKELDFYIHDSKLAIEFNGIYWHSTAKIKDTKYHFNKWKSCHEKGVRLLMINEDEWLNGSERIKKKILNLCGRSERSVGARSLTVQEIPSKEANVFLERHHIQGKAYGIRTAYGAYNGDELVGVMAFNNQRGTGALELIRFCTDGKIYAGMFSKIFKKFVTDYPDISEIVSFADLRYSDGNLYGVTGFVKERIIPPDYRYVINGKTRHKSSFTRARIEKKYGIVLGETTEKQAMEDLGHHRIYDCGKIRFVWKRVT